MSFSSSSGLSTVYTDPPIARPPTSTLVGSSGSFTVYNTPPTAVSGSSGPVTVYTDQKVADDIIVTTTGPVSLTGVTTETNLATLKIPAGSMGKNGVVEVRALWAYTNSANNKSLIFRFSTVAGQTTGAAASSMAVTTTATAQTLVILRNNNASNAQVMLNTTPVSPFLASTLALNTLSVDTTQDCYVNINGTLASAAETLTLQHAAGVVFPAP